MRIVRHALFGLAATFSGALVVSAAPTAPLVPAPKGGPAPVSPAIPKVAAGAVPVAIGGRTIARIGNLPTFDLAKKEVMTVETAAQAVRGTITQTPKGAIFMEAVQVTVTAVGFSCLQETSDTANDGGGAGDEVYVSVFG